MSSKSTPKVRFTTKQVMAGFGVSDMTVWTWRQGTAQREKLPVEQEGRNVYFPLASTEKWAKKHGLAFSRAKAEAVTTAPKSGPKPVEKKPAPKAKAAAKEVKADKPKRKAKVARAPLANKTTTGPVAAQV